MYCLVLKNHCTLNTMPENDVKTVLKAVLADQKKTNTFLQKVFAFSPKESTAIDADQLAKKLDRNSLAALLIEAVVRFQDSMDVMQKAAVQIDLCKDEMIMSQKKIEKLQDKLITSQEDSLEKLTKSAETLAGVSETVKSDVQELVEQKRTYAELVAKDDSVEAPAKVIEKEVLKEAMAETNKEDERLRSVIISGMDAGFDPAEMKHELDQVLDAIEVSHLQSQVVSAIYVGKKYTAAKGPPCRLIKATFSSIAGATQCLGQSRLLKGNIVLGDVYINPDRPLSERIEIKKLVTEMKEKIDKDPSVYWKISKMKLVSFEKTPRNV